MNGVSSEWHSVYRGVSPGINPWSTTINFVAFVNDLPDAVKHCTVNQYVDDIAIYVSDVDPTEVGRKLEEDLVHIAK